MLATPQQQAALEAVFRNGTKLTYKKGEFIIHPGETPVGVFLIHTGMVKAYDISKYGEENMLIIRRKNELFPLIWAFTGQDRRIIYQALVPTEVWRIARQDFLDEVNKNPELLRPLLDVTTEMYRIHSERILNLEYRTVRERLISFLVTMSRRFGRKTTGGTLIDIPLKQQDIASSINATRETTSRELMRLERLGLISNHQSLITLTDVDKLKSFL